MSVKKKIINNGIASTLQKGVKVAEQLLLVPFFISAWGAAYYGEWLTLTIIPSVLGLSELGFGTATCNSFVLKYASGDKEGAANVAKTGFVIISVMVLMFILLSFVTIYLLNFNGVFDKTLIDKNQAIISVSFLLLARIMGFYMPLYESHFRAARRASLGLNILSIYAAINLAVGVALLLLKYDIVIYALSNLIISAIFTIIYAAIAVKTLPINKEYKTIFLKSEAVIITRNGFGYLLSPIWQAIFFQGTTFAVRLTLGPLAVTIFNTVRTLTRAITQANTIVSYTIMPELQYEMGAGNYTQVKKLFRLGIITIFAIAIVGVIFLLIGGPWFYELWTNKTLNPPETMWNVFVMCILFNGMWGFGSDVLIAANRPYDFTIIATLVAIISVLSTYFLAKYFGLTGASYSSLILEVTLFIYILPKSIKLIEYTIKDLLLQIINDINNFKRITINKCKSLIGV